jgi:hypothetical protein
LPISLDGFIELAVKGAADDACDGDGCPSVTRRRAFARKTVPRSIMSQSARSGRMRGLEIVVVRRRNDA